MMLAPLPTKYRAAGGDIHIHQINIFTGYGPAPVDFPSRRWSSANSLFNYGKRASSLTDCWILKYSVYKSKANRPREFPLIHSDRSYDFKSHSHENQWTRLMWSLMKTGTVYLPKKSVSDINYADSDSTHGRLHIGGIAQSRTPQNAEKTKKQNPFPWLINLAGPPGVPGEKNN